MGLLTSPPSSYTLLREDDSPYLNTVDLASPRWLLSFCDKVLLLNKTAQYSSEKAARDYR